MVKYQASQTLSVFLLTKIDDLRERPSNVGCFRFRAFGVCMGSSSKNESSLSSTYNWHECIII